MDRTFVYLLHIPKTAGTTVRTLLESSSLRGRVIDGYHLNVVTGNEETIRSMIDSRPEAGVFAAHLDWTVTELIDRPSLAVVTFLRDPVARTMSAFRHFQRRGFDGQIDDFIRSHPAQTINTQTRRLAGWIGGNAGFDDVELLDMARAHLRDDRCLFGITERFKTSMSLISRQLSWDLAAETKPRNVAPTYDGASPGERTAIERVTVLDRKLYDMANELLSARSREQTQS